MKNSDSQDTLGFLLSRTYYAYKKAVTKALAPYGITPEQYGILLRLSNREAISQKELAELHARDQTAVGKIIGKLEHKKLIVRIIVDPRDRRAVLLYLTDYGKGLVEELVPLMRLTEKQAASNLSDAEYNRFTELLSVIYQSISD